MSIVSGIASFNTADGLPNNVMSKLNRNFWLIANAIKDPDIVMTASYSKPEPRTNETLWYDLGTGELWIWALTDVNDPLLPEDDTWEWKKLDLGIAHVDDDTPSVSAYQRDAEFLWYDSSEHDLYVYTQLPGGMQAPQWYLLPEYIHQCILYYLGMSDVQTAIQGIVSAS